MQDPREEGDDKLEKTRGMVPSMVKVEVEGVSLARTQCSNYRSAAFSSKQSLG